MPLGAAIPQVVGYLERVTLPRWGLALTAKVDTGADTSALHAEDVQALGTTRVAFTVPPDADAGVALPVQARIVRRGLVRCSSGDEEERIFVRTAITLGDRTQVVELGLVDRSRMQHRMLLGRSALGGSFLVDPGRVFLSSRDSDPG